MADFMIRFLACNILLCGIIRIFLLMKRTFKNILSSRMQYNLWFLLDWQFPFCLFAFLNYQRCLLLFLMLKQRLP